ncbi:hypothetical protein NLI96_g7853 [Meripilus lineatus]|uniref:Uncharacterized protein n=1 Tax=Meripilus lineatus TaxID=2056292 RepID=A0AAD5YGS5_9APHY|nr:hypothetical protein NLI96_g7853 [Physisporinus lineatus]
MTTPYTPMSRDFYDDEPTNINDSARPHSIDLTLELEQQLDDESTPSSPAFPQSHSRPHSLDSHVLASLVTQLRISLADTSRERDELTAMLSETQSNEASMKDALHNLAEKCVRLETELSASQEKNREDADAISMLRGKLEDSRYVSLSCVLWVFRLPWSSRRALMRLQTENRRTSQIIDIGRGLPSPSIGAPPSKRSSFIPLQTSTAVAGRVNAHRRISSVSEPGNASVGLNLDGGAWPSSPPPTTSEFGQHPPPTSSNRRQSGFWARPLSLQPDLPTTVDSTELEEMRKELQTVKDQLDEAKSELAEAQEAQEASETCVKALRTFIAENSIGMQTTTTGPANPIRREETAHKPAAPSLSSRWGFKLWKVDTSTNLGATSPTTPSSSLHSTMGSPPSSNPPLSKFGGLFSSRTSTSSGHPDVPSRHPHPEMTCNTSDSSSLDDVVAEPISPVSETPRTHVSVHVAGEPSSEILLFPSQIKETHSFHEATTVSPG